MAKQTLSEAGIQKMQVYEIETREDGADIQVEV